ncbi:MAG: hypothetical protein U0414_00090 [Polyangiaceae bacterium]
MSPTSSKAATVHSERVSMAATVLVDGSTIEVDVRITNLGTADIYLTDVVLDPRTHARAEAALQVRYEPPVDGAPPTVVLWRYLSPPEPNISWAAPPTAFVTRVAPSATHHISLRPLAPLRVATAAPQYGPDGELTGWTGPVVECTRVRLELGVITDNADLAPRAFASGDETLYSVGGEALDHQTVVAVDVDDLRVPLITRRGAP